MIKKGRLEDEYLKYDPDMDLVGSGEKELGHSLAERMLQKYGSIENIPKLVTKKDEEVKLAKKENDLEKTLTFLSRVRGMGVNPDALFNDRNAKETLIREYKGDRKYLSGFSDYKLGAAFKSVYYSALKKTKK
jgi:hypothetical protein